MKRRTQQKANPHEGYLINEDIRHKTVQVIDDEGENRGELAREDALDLARSSGLDLVQVGERGDVAIAKIMDFGKFLYARKKKIMRAKKSQKVIQVKEIKMRPKIGIGDYTTKMGQALKFLKEGKHVKFSLQFRGRQPVSVKEVGEQFFDRIRGDIEAANLGTIVEDKESKSRIMWSKIFYIK